MKFFISSLYLLKSSDFKGLKYSSVLLGLRRLLNFGVDLRSMILRSTVRLSLNLWELALLKGTRSALFLGLPWSEFPPVDSILARSNTGVVG